eukprot:442135-Rhodomonas_salina.4
MSRCLTAAVAPPVQQPEAPGITDDHGNSLLMLQCAVHSVAAGPVASSTASASSQHDSDLIPGPPSRSKSKRIYAALQRAGVRHTVTRAS